MTASSGLLSYKGKGCAVIDAVKNGDIAESRHNSYCNMYEEAKKIKEWEL